MSKNKQLPGLITGLVALLAVAAFFIINFAGNGWEYSWMVFLAIPLAAIISNFVFTKKNKLGHITGAVAILCVIGFFLLGALGHLWSFAWIIFLLIPITGIIVNMVKTVRNDKEDGQQEEKDEENSEQL